MVYDISTVQSILVRPLRRDLNPYQMDQEEKANMNKREIYITEKFRLAVYRQPNHVCRVCEPSLYNGEPVELHHKIPVKDGGK